MQKIIIDSFAGGGGASLGIEMAIGRSPDIAINHDPQAIAMHEANHPTTLHVLEDVWKSDLRKLVGKRKVGLLHASPDCKHFSRAKGGTPVSKEIRSLAWVVVKWASQLRPDIITLENVREFCFPGETTVVTKRGVIPLAEVQIGDYVMTHNNRWRAVIAKSESRKPVVSINGGGNNLIRSTADHRFYARKVDVEITQSGKSGRHRSQILEPEWTPAAELAPRHSKSSYVRTRTGVAWASPHLFPRYWMRLPEINGTGSSNSEAFFYMLGRWLGDGWIKVGERRKKGLRICCAKHETELLAKRLEATGMRWKLAEQRESVDIFEAYDTGLVEWIIANFREKAQGKTLPAWMFTAPPEFRRKLIHGWADADSHERPNGKCVGSSVSRCLAVGMKLLLQSLDIPASVGVIDEPRDAVIQGKTCTCVKSYYVTWHWNRQWQKGWKSERHLWNRVRSVSDPSDNEETVYDITVDEDHSFIADGMVVHNCDWGPIIPRWECPCGWKGTEGQAVLHRTKRSCPRCGSRKLSETDNMMPDPAKKGATFRLFVNRLRGLGYEVEWRDLNAADYGSPTNRRRLFLVARCDGRQIVWPSPTHGNPAKIMATGLKPWRTAAECIDWTIECPSIFDRARPLKETTLRRIATGIKRFVLDAKQPFIVRCNHGGDHFRGQAVDNPFCTVTSSRDAHGLVLPILSKYHGQKSEESRCKQLELPFNTLDTQPRYALVAPVIERMFGNGRGADIAMPLGTTTAGGGKSALVAASIIPTGYGERNGQAPRCTDAQEPLNTVVASQKHALVTAFIAKHYGGMVGVSAETPLPTTTMRGTQNQVVEAAIAPVAQANSKAQQVYAFLTKYFGTSIGQPVTEPLGTATTKDRYGVVTVTIDGEEFAIVDIGMRMLTPRELARAQGFPDSYVLTGSKTSQVARIGNSVCPQVAEALVAANVKSKKRVTERAT